MNITTNTTALHSVVIDVPPPSVVHVLRSARNDARQSISSVRELLEGLEILEQALTAKIHGKKVDEEAIKEIRNLSDLLAFTLAEDAERKYTKNMLGNAYAAGELDQALKALDYDGTWEALFAQNNSGFSTEGVGLDQLLPAICQKELKAWAEAGDEDEELDDL